MSITNPFDPARDGWYFENWGEANHFIGSPDFPWELYRQTYLGINPTEDPVQAPLDSLFYEIFKGCAGEGNCGGMTLLALALYKYGGYKGYCSPACFYTGVGWPDRQDLHRTINIFQARQFSAPGIENFLDVVSAGNLSNAHAAYNKIKAHLGSGDYALISLADDMLGDAAHTLVPYEYNDSPAGEPAGTKYLYLYDPNYPYDVHADYYTTRRNRLVIRGAFDWEYRQGFYNGVEHNGTHYTGSGGDPGWCFAIPMSVILHKARHPIAVDMVIEGLISLFVSGPGTAVAQIEDETGRHFYKTESDGHVKRGEIETDPDLRLADAGLWPWFDKRDSTPLPGELYFMRRPPGSPPLKVTLYGSDYKLSYQQAGDIVEVQARGAQRARDVVRIAGVATGQQALSLETAGSERRYDIKQQRLFSQGTAWRSIDLRDVRVNRGGVEVQAVGDMEAVEVSSQAHQASFKVELQQYDGEVLKQRITGRQNVAVDRSVRFTPEDWRNLDKTEIKKKATPRSKRS